ncbi:MAG: lipase maturation factor family protein, partial [Polyangia bacterium]
MIGAREFLRRLQPRDHSGPVVARLFHRLLAVIFLDAWLSLGVQVHVLIGSRGLMPIAAFLARARHQLSFADFPTLFWLGVTDTTLTLGVVAGVGLALVGIFGRWPRTVAAAQVVLYLSFTTAARTFLSFQWDNLIIECAFFAIFLPCDRRSPWMHTLFRLILLKLYWESGVAKWQSHLHDWQDGSAMTYYYETAPLPAALAWYMHHAPSWWHHAESWATLGFELGVPFGIFVGFRRVRLACAAILTSFQIINAATANYGFFCYLAAALHVFLLDDGDVTRVLEWLRARVRLPVAKPIVAGPNRQWGRWTVRGILTVFIVVSGLDALVSFVDSDRLFAVIMPARRVWAPFRLVNTYHLFGHITRARIEAEFQTTDDGTNWTAHDLRHKPGAPTRRPDWVAPHQPRVDFQLWFYGLSYRAGTPEYVATLIERLCRDPAAVQPLFRAPLPP